MVRGHESHYTRGEVIMKYDFSSIGDAELLRMEAVLGIELDYRLGNMIMNGELELIYDKLEEIEAQKNERGL